VRVVLAIGILLTLLGLAWLLNVLGAADYTIRRVTSRYLGTLPPGFAATTRGFRVYAVLVLALGVLCIGLGTTERFLPLAAGLIVIGAIAFGIASMLAISGEVEVYRKQKS
jgi:hypothetical protein